ncbi:MAG: GAF domain-containing protein, partial [Hyphomicrobiaceae bacterium]
VGLDEMQANIRFHELGEESFTINDVKVSTQFVNHNALTLGYRLEADNVAVVYATDHEPFSPALAGGQGDISGMDRKHCAFLADADLVIHDAQYLAEEYPDKIGWGHSTVEYAVAVCAAAGASKLALTHHDLLRSDDEVEAIVSHARAQHYPGPKIEVIAAAEGEELIIEPRANPSAIRGQFQKPSTTIVDAPSIFMQIDKHRDAQIIRQIAESDTINLLDSGDSDPDLHQILQSANALIVIEQQGDIDQISQLLDRFGLGKDHDLAVVVIAEADQEPLLVQAGYSNVLVRPFSLAYARTRVQAALLRCGCRWQRSMTTPNEEDRLKTLQRLGILDSSPEDRFDRIARLAATIFETPTAAISLVDRDRQWFKSARGLEANETSREVSFCAHAVESQELLVVPDALQDPRFADNPLVTGIPHIRFYAGCPVFVDGHCLGTVCILGDRPRHISPSETEALRDLAALTEIELLRSS